MSVELDGREYGCEFGHVQMFVDALKPLEEYKAIEAQLNRLAEKGSFDPFSGGMRFLSANSLPGRVQEGRAEWEALAKEAGRDLDDPAAFAPPGKDIVEQLLVGLGWRVTAEHVGPQTRSLLVTSQDAMGVKFVVTAKHADATAEPEAYDHFAAEHVDRYMKSMNGRQGIAVLGFELPETGALEATVERYRKLHPKLFIGTRSYEDTREVTDASGATSKLVLGKMSVMEAYAYYQTDKSGEADTGAVLRFMHRTGTYGAKEGFGNPQGVLPGLEDVVAAFDGTSIPAYADHWVSNVVDRHSFLDTLQDVLGFTPKVDFNAGVVAAGRAKIESTVTGNNTAKIKDTCDTAAILRDQSQIYLPINNALSDVGHVHFFLQEMGQGVQHLASRVKDLVAFIERVNNYRIITGAGFSFLDIPRSYYGHLATSDLVEACGGDEAKAEAALQALRAAGFCSPTGIVDLDTSDDDLVAAMATTLSDADALAAALAVVKASRYSNLYKLLRDHFTEDTYLQIVRNKILVDIQGNDILFQIFTCNILQRKAGEEAPFLEFIQRVCSQKKLADGSCAPIKPGCGGFGIRNFLTLFLSIEVSKAMKEVDAAVASGDAAAEARGRQRVEIFTRQLDESNPVLTAISDAMTAEGDALEEIKSLEKQESKDEGRLQELQQIVAEQVAKKVAGNEELQALSERYAQLMKDL